MLQIRSQLLVMAFASLLVWIVNIQVLLQTYAHLDGSSWLHGFTLTLSGAFFLLLPTVAVFLMDLWRCNPSDSHTYSTLWQHYVIGWLRYVTGRRQWNDFRLNATNASVAQERCVLEMIFDSQGTSYGVEHAFRTFETADDYLSFHPLTTYDYYEPYIDRILNAEENVLCPGGVKYLGVTSGTKKRIPIGRPTVKEMIEVTSLASYVNKQYFPSNFGLQKVLRVTPSLVSTEGPNKIRIGPYSVGATPKKQETNSTPSIVNDVDDECALMYLHALFGLRERRLRYASLHSPLVGNMFFATLADNWVELCDDIAEGKLSSALKIPHFIRKEIELLIQPDERRSDEVREEFTKGFNNILPRLWPELEGVELLASGTFFSTAMGLRRRYFSSVPIISAFHAATEGLFGANLEPYDMNNPVYTPMILHTFYEFIPMDEVMKESPVPLSIEDEPKIGEDYELVVTTNRGLYRYRTGDVIRIVDYYEAVPQYMFMYRLDQTISMFGEKTTEADMHDAIVLALKKFPRFSIVDYTTTDSRSLHKDTGLPYYVLMFELAAEDHGDERLSPEDKTEFDKALTEISENYRSLRTEGKLGPINVFQLEKWSFVDLKRYLRKGNAELPLVHYKTPKYTSDQEILDFLLRKEIS